MWVPSHVGITNNKIADKSADLATKTISHPTIADLLYNDIKASTNHKIIMAWKNHWDSV